MELLNATKMIAGYTMGMKPDGRELLVVAIKGTFTLPRLDEPAQLAAEQVKLVEADAFTGEPGKSAPLYETDYAPFKPRCDVVLNGSAYAPGGKPTKRVEVALQVGPINKRFDVVGNRRWDKTLMVLAPTSYEPFTVMPISYDRAYGGTDNTHPNEKKHGAYFLNPIGVGFHTNTDGDIVNGKALPNTEAPGERVSNHNGKYRPMAFGPVGRGWKPRMDYAGTYDDAWLEHTFPFLPADFKDDYYQCAPADQQMPYPKGGEEIILANLTPHGFARFRLPTLEMPIEFSMANYERNHTAGVIDTIVIEPDLNRFTMTWRAALPLKRNMFEVAQVVVGKMPRAWYRARELGKTYYPSLDALAESKRAETEEA